MFIDFLDRLEGSVRSRSGIVIVTGTFNAKSPTGGAIKRMQKGEL